MHTAKWLIHRNIMLRESQAERGTCAPCKLGRRNKMTANRSELSVSGMQWFTGKASPWEFGMMWSLY